MQLKPKINKTISSLQTIKPFAKKILTVIAFLFLIIFILCSIYMLIVYIEFLSNRNSIFAKIRDFSTELEKGKETDITLGFDDKNKKAPSFFLDRNKKVITKYSSQKHKLIPLRRIPFF